MKARDSRWAEAHRILSSAKDFPSFPFLAVKSMEGKLQLR